MLLCDLHFDLKYYYMGVRVKPVCIKWCDSKNTISSQSNESVWFQGINKCDTINPNLKALVLIAASSRCLPLGVRL
jgi:hypothetical protein